MDTASQTQIDWYLAALPQKTKKAFLYLAEQKWLKETNWYLAGGTALALHINHRQSFDLDFFLPQKTFRPQEVIKHFNDRDWRAQIVREGTIYGELFGARISFIAYPFFVAKQTPNWYGSIRVITPRDVIVMKIIAISQRGRKRDFIDLYWFCANMGSLEEVLNLLQDQYPTVAHDYHHILKSLVYFEDADADPMPRVNFRIGWLKVKRYFHQEVSRIAKKIL